ncbi:hypothetical protein YP76_09945 [Sphingobium chungbukense]|uniref:Uncharacterized protein n=1 Tax=Sphingobium chungbukense TaxID=56193 RepID=A0A0M3AQR9_9SPHN|nr:hypothetical protein YP76_09945 [Sphingobium chungbukense]
MIVLSPTKLPASVTPAFVDNGATMRSATNAKGLRLNRLGNHFRAAVTMPISRADDAAGLIADLIAAKEEGLRMAYPLQGVDQGVPGAPVVNGAAQAGKTINLRGLTPGYIARKGFWVSIVNEAGQHFLHNVRAEATANAGGLLALPINPMLRYAFADGAAVFLAQPMIEGEISGNEQSWQIVRGGRITGLAFMIEEMG